MEISLDLLLKKMEQEIAKAKKDGKENMLHHVYSIMTMCELILEAEPPGKKEAIPNSTFTDRMTGPASIKSVGFSQNQGETLQTDDGVNGESIFDF
ncbi:hypothetical protein J2S13_000599 [Oikeobacillus pervagus]|uniref:YwdI family protein n=1 Tax=Oikeobacillus pervagus TaxID=1325931 RepID=A0AAJ1WIA4_9BACI|nr:YwdI family protein [Oikeobacillus pervagus]MDQ0214203.1 hypothetical protein [Oikeobacillus pervagus]